VFALILAAMLVASAAGVESPATKTYALANSSIGADTAPLFAPEFAIVVYVSELMVEPTLPTDKIFKDRQGVA
jgi:hypothetical protein